MTSLNWDSNCWVGISSPYDTAGHSILPVQRILRARGFLTSGSNDGIYGSATRNAVLQYQNSSAALAADGVVGNSTWDHMVRYKVDFGSRFTSGIYHYYKVIDSNNYSVAVRRESPYTWYTANRTNSAYPLMDVEGPS